MEPTRGTFDPPPCWGGYGKLFQLPGASSSQISLPSNQQGALCNSHGPESNQHGALCNGHGPESRTKGEQIIYINSVSLSICPGRYILNPCEQGVIFVFNVPSWTCLSVYVDKNCAVLGRFFQSLPVSCGTSGHDSYFFRGRGEGVGMGF